jgi:hypothetical protein
MGAYLASLERLRTMRPPLRAIAPGHGHLIEDPQVVLTEYLEHRLERERQVLEAVRAGGDGGVLVADIVPALYPGLIDELVPRARQSVHAHLRKLEADGAVVAPDADDEATVWSPK